MNLPELDLPIVDLREYAQKIRNYFNITDVPDEEIDYDSMEHIPKEIDRRRRLFQYFIPDVFEPGQYDRRADLIDGCIYFLEVAEKTGNQSIVYNLWTKRTKIRQQFKTEDVEQDTYGYMFYHPILSVIGMGHYLDYLLPTLVKRIRIFQGWKQKLDLNTYSIIFLNSFNSIKPTELTAKLRIYLCKLNKVLKRIPMLDAINLKRCMKEWGFKNVNVLYAQLNKIGLIIHNYFEKRIFGLESFVFCCPYPNHVRVRVRKGAIKQAFATGGKRYIQMIWTFIPVKENWKLLYRKFPPQTQCYRVIKLPSIHQDPLKYFNSETQEWVFPWDSFVKEWRESLDKIMHITKPVTLPKPTVKPTKELIQICEVLESNANLKNSMLHRHTKIPLDRITQIRSELDQKALVVRTFIFYFHNISDATSIFIPGIERWKYELLSKLGEASVHYLIHVFEHMKDHKKYLSGFYLHTPQQGLMFHKAVNRAFRGILNYHFEKQLFQASFSQSWTDLFDPETQHWKWSPNNYKILPLKTLFH